MKVGDFFSGLKGWSEAFLQRGHDIITYDIGESFEPDICGDILDIYEFPKLDAALFSPPCHTVSTMRMGSNWTHQGEPKTEEASNARELFLKCIEIIEYTKPRFFIIENPRARLRTLGYFDRYERRTITMCRYGSKRMKPTDLWGGFPKSLVLRDMCKNNRTPWSTKSNHILAPRGSTSGTQGMDPSESAKIPFELSLEICIAMEHDFQGV